MLCCALRIATPMQARDAMLAGRARRAEQRHLGLPAESVLSQAQHIAVLDDLQVLPYTSLSCPVMSRVLQLYIGLKPYIGLAHSFLIPAEPYFMMSLTKEGTVCLSLR